MTAAAVEKRGSTREVAVQALVASRLPGLTPKVLAVRDLADAPGRVSFTMPDVAGAGLTPLATLLAAAPTEALKGYRAAMRLLALLHKEFSAPGQHGAAEIGLDDALDRARATPAPGNGPPNVVATLRVELAAGPPDAWRAAERTLLHGDLHPGNIWVAEDGAVALLDWGESLLGPPAWDLALFPKGLVDEYAAARRAVEPGWNGDFDAQVRWASVVRAAYLLSSIADSVAVERLFSSLELALGV